MHSGFVYRRPAFDRAQFRFLSLLFSGYRGQSRQIILIVYGAYAVSLSFCYNFQLGDMETLLELQ